MIYICELIKKTNWKIAVLFSALLSFFSQFNIYQPNAEITFQHQFFTWSAIFLFLLCSWVVNSVLTLYFKQRFKSVKSIEKTIGILLFNIFLLALLIMLSKTILFQNYIIFNYSIAHIFFRGTASILLIFITQFALNTNAKAQEVTIQNEMLKTENIKAQFEILRQQVNPHFLFNSLSTLRSMIRTKNEKSEVFVLKLSEIYRKLLLKRNDDFVTLKEEIGFINDYSFMLFARFDNMLQIKIEIQQEALEMKLPTFSLQVLLENCVKHNIISRESPLVVRIFNTNTESVTIENNLQPKIGNEEHSGYGLPNLVQRYSLLGFPDGVSVFSTENLFRVKIKLF